MATDNPKQLSIDSSPERLASGFLEEFQSSGAYSRRLLDRLIELVISEDEKAAESASRAFFARIIAQLSDSFDPAAVSLYNRAFAHLIERARRSPRGEAIDSKLKNFRLQSEDDLVARAENLRRIQSLALQDEAKTNLRRVVVLSRVTLGADVAITSVIMERMKLEFPNAEITLVGGRKAAELFGGGRRVSFKEISYTRAGSAIERLLSWIDLLSVVREATFGLNRGEYLIVDPDSRLTQLGLLPVGVDEQSSDDYLFFPSREYGSNTNHSLGQLISLWLDEVFASHKPIYPRVSLGGTDVDRAGKLIKLLRKSISRQVVTINFGVGENPAKRVGDEFEKSLVARLITDGVAVILDKGAGEEESRRADAIIENARQASIHGRSARIIEINEEALTSLSGVDAPDADLLVWSGRIGLLAALISESNFYIGYDSAGQHIAAALGVPSIDVFAGHSSPRMLDRWRPTGRAETRVVATDSSCKSEEAILSDVLGHAGELVGSRR